MKPKWIVLLSIVISLSGCKLKVYWLPGSLETGGAVSRCSKLQALNGFLAIKNEVDELVRRSLETQDADELKAIVNQLALKTQTLKTILEPAYTDQVVNATYRFPIQNIYLQGDLKPVPEKISIFGFDLPVSEASVPNLQTFPNEGPTTDILFSRKVSLLEICALTGTVQGLISVQNPNQVPVFYYRLVVDQVN